MYLRRSLQLSGVIGFLAFPKMGRARRHVAAVSQAVAMFIFEASVVPQGTKLPEKKYRFSIILGIILPDSCCQTISVIFLVIVDDH